MSVRVTSLEAELITSGTSNNTTTRVTSYEVQAVITGNSELDTVRTTAYEVQAVTSIFNKTCVVAVSC